MTKRRGRPAGFKMPEEHRTKIANSKILNRLIGHVEGTEDMSTSQVQAGLGLLKKCLPDLTSVELSGPKDSEGNPTEIVMRIVSPDG